MNEEILEKIKDILAEKGPVEKDEDRQKLSGETTFKDLERQYKFDSIDQIAFFMEVESEFHISIPDDDTEKIKSLGDLVDHIDKVLKEKEKARKEKEEALKEKEEARKKNATA